MGLVGVAVAAHLGVAQDAAFLGAAVVGEGDLAGVPVDGDLAAVGAVGDVAGGRGAFVTAAVLLPRLRAALAAADGVVDDEGAADLVGVGRRSGVLEGDLGGGNGLREGEDGAELEELHDGN